MWMKPGARALRFSAIEHFTVDRVGFRWQARFPIVPLVAIRVLDGYSSGEGALRVSVLGIPLQRQSGRDLSLGEAMRYLSELPWFPYAIATYSELEWGMLMTDTRT